MRKGYADTHKVDEVEMIADNDEPAGRAASVDVYEEEYFQGEFSA